MKLDFTPEELTTLAKVLVPEVAKELRPLLSKAQDGDRVFGVKELAEYLGQKPSWVYAHTSDIPHTKKGGLLMFKKSTIDKWLEPDYYPGQANFPVLDRRGGYEKTKGVI